MPHTRHADTELLPADLLDRYVAGEATLAEIARVEGWIAVHQDAVFVLELLRGGDDDASRAIALRASMEQRWTALVSHMEGMGRWSGALPKQVGRMRVVPWLSQRVLRPVAAIMALFVVTVIGWKAGLWTMGHRESASVSVYTTGNGERANITLLDGSTVTLNVASRLEVPGDYLAGHRTVRLIGEGLFTVTRHDGTPFMVNAGSATARVLGTSFVVRRYPTDSVTTVAVREGRVAVQSVVLAAGRELEIGAGGPHESWVSSARFSFATGVLKFDGTPLRDAIPMLNRWFDADIRLQDDALGERQVTGGFPAGSLADLIESLTLTFNVRVVRDGRVLTVYQK